jgi:benzoyl-CoA reductase/2-hydroxyglutaryl-CoA dehydratase subunit BcrC/BadD/HgdB
VSSVQELKQQRVKVIDVVLDELARVKAQLDTRIETLRDERARLLVHVEAVAS